MSVAGGTEQSIEADLGGRHVGDDKARLGKEMRLLAWVPSHV